MYKLKTLFQNVITRNSTQYENDGNMGLVRQVSVAQVREWFLWSSLLSNQSFIGYKVLQFLFYRPEPISNG